MPLIGINQPSPEPVHKDAMDRVAQALGIAQGVLGTALAIPEYMQKKAVAESEISKNKILSDRATANTNQPFAEKELDNFYKNHNRANAGTPGAETATLMNGLTVTGTPKPYMDNEAENQESNLRKEYTEKTKKFFEQADAYHRSLAIKNDPAGAIAMIKNTSTLYNPDLASRSQTDIEELGRQGNLPGEAQNLFNMVASPEGYRKMPDTIFKQFTELNRSIFQKATEEHAADNKDYKSLAFIKGFNPDNVVLPNREIQALKNLDFKSAGEHSGDTAPNSPMKNNPKIPDYVRKFSGVK